LRLLNHRREGESMFKDARKGAELSIEAAAFRLHIGSRTLTNYENGHSTVPPDVALKMSEEYGRPDIHARYCSEYCPIGQKHANPVEFRDLEGSVLGVIKELNDVKALKNDLIDITADGKISRDEAENFRRILKEYRELGQKIETLKLWAMANGIWAEKERPRKAAMC
jgi:transcriptional regulator with XRE-family HTH domain